MCGILRDIEVYAFLRVSLIFGAVDVDRPSSSSSSSPSPSTSIDAVSGGLIASGDGPCASRPGPPGGRNDPDEAPGENKLLPDAKAPDSVGDVAAAGGLAADAAGVMGGAPELNSAHLGHLRLVSEQQTAVEHLAAAAKRRNLLMCPIWPQWPQRLCQFVSKRSY